jgi:ribosomal protein L37E
MRIGFHLTLMILAQFAGFALGALAGFALLPADFRSAAAPLDFVLVVGGAVAGTLAAGWAVGRVAARCPRCGGRAFPRGSRPITYHCAACGHAHETRVRSNW